MDRHMTQLDVMTPVMKCPMCGEAMVTGGRCECGYEDGTGVVLPEKGVLEQ